MTTLYFIKPYECYNAHEQATLEGAEAQALCRAGIALLADSPEAEVARAAHTPLQGEPPPQAHRTIRTNASRVGITAWLKG